jgi:hypothetical protein
MPLENGQQGTEKQHPENLHKATEEEEGADLAVSGSAASSEAVDHEPAPQTAPADVHESLYAEASLTKKIVVFALTTAVVLIVLGAIYAYWPHGTLPPPR